MKFVATVVLVSPIARIYGTRSFYVHVLDEHGNLVKIIFEESFVGFHGNTLVSIVLYNMLLELCNQFLLFSIFLGWRYIVCGEIHR